MLELGFEQQDELGGGAVLKGEVLGVAQTARIGCLVAKARSGGQVCTV